MPVENTEIHKVSYIINGEQVQKIISYFKNKTFKVVNIYNSSRDSWTYQTFQEKVFNQGPTLILLKTLTGAICGGYTSKNWDHGNK